MQQGQPGGYSVSVHTYLFLKWPWATHWTLAAPEASLLLAMSSDPLSVWMCLRGICKEFLISLYTGSTLKPCVRLYTASCTLNSSHLSFGLHARARLHRSIRLTHLLCTLFSFLALCGFLNLTRRARCEAWMCGKSTPEVTLWSSGPYTLCISSSFAKNIP